MVGPAAQRAGAAHLKAAMGLSERRACSIIGADRTMVRYRSRRPPDTELRARLRELANERRRFGYRRLFILLRREGELSGINRVHRLYREEGLAVRKRRARRKAVGVRVPILLEARQNARWSLDFVYDQFANGRRFRVLNIVDDVTKECLGANSRGFGWLDCMSPPQMRRLTLDVATRVTRMDRAEPQTRRVSRGSSYRSLCRNRYVKIA
jgi:putative transposase